MHSLPYLKAINKYKTIKLNLVKMCMTCFKQVNKEDPGRIEYVCRKRRQVW